MLRALCVFCGSSCGTRPAYLAAARLLGLQLAVRNITLVYGGAHVGLMGAVADACLSGGGRVIGVMPQTLVDREVAHHGLTELHVVDSMHSRKAMMAQLSDAFVALPGGFGTFEEYFEVLTWAGIGIHQKPCYLLNIENYYGPLLTMADHALAEGFLRPAWRNSMLAETDPVRLLDILSGEIL